MFISSLSRHGAKREAVVAATPTASEMFFFEEEEAATALGMPIVSIDYRKAPEHPYPAAPEDCYAGVCWVFEHGAKLGMDTSNIGLMGASAGGGLALAVALMLRDREGPALKYLLPIYPMIDDRHETASSHEILDIGIWDRAGSIEAWGWYLGGAEADA